MRKPRQLKKGASYHVIARTNRNEFILKDKEIKELFLQVVKNARKKYKFTVINLCIMDNHVHMIIEPEEEMNLSKIMQWILSVFAIKFNRIFSFIGHVWYDRFKSKIIDDIRQMVATYRYIAENPVKAGIVNKPEEYEYNGITFIKKGIFDILAPPSQILLEQY